MSAAHRYNAAMSRFWQLFNVERPSKVVVGQVIQHLILAYADVVSEDDQFWHITRSDPSSFGMNDRIPKLKDGELIVYPVTPQEAIRQFLSAVLAHKRQLNDTLRQVDVVLRKVSKLQHDYPDPNAPEEHAKNLELHAEDLSEGRLRDGQYRLQSDGIHIRTGPIGTRRAD